MKTNRLTSTNARIVLAFSLLSGMLFILSTVVLLSLARIETTVTMLLANTVPRLSYIGSLRENAGLLQTLTLRHILTEDPASKAQLEYMLGTTKETVARLLQLKQQLSLSNQGLQLSAALQEQYGAYTVLIDKIIALSRDGQEAEAKRQHRGLLLAKYAQYQSLLDDLETYITAEAQKHEGAVRATVAAVKKVCFFLSAAGLLVAAIMSVVILGVVKTLRRENRSLQFEITQRERAEEKNLGLIAELQQALESIKQLRGLLPICCSCKKIRNDRGYWEKIETYISQHSEAQFTHGICPDCAEKLYPGVFNKIKK
jgi:hypothetical protein